MMDSGYPPIFTERGIFLHIPKIDYKRQSNHKSNDGCLDNVADHMYLQLVDAIMPHYPAIEIRENPIQ